MSSVSVGGCVPQFRVEYVEFFIPKMESFLGRHRSHLQRLQIAPARRASVQTREEPQNIYSEGLQQTK